MFVNESARTPAVNGQPEALKADERYQKPQLLAVGEALDLLRGFHGLYLDGVGWYRTDRRN
jgi:hypothetical protein